MNEGQWGGGSSILRCCGTYVENTCKCRFVVSTGGLQDTLGPKRLEYACLGAPMLGRGLPFEAPWLDDCLFPVDPMNVTLAELKAQLEHALERHKAIRENCLNWRDRLLKLHEPNAVLEALQAQIDGKPVPEGYLKRTVPCGPA